MNKLLIYILLVLSGFTQAQSASDFLSDVQKKFAEIKDFKAEFVQSTKYLTVENNVILKGKFYYKSGGKYRIELQNQTIVSDGVTVWNLNTKLNRLVINNVSEDPSAFSIDKFIFDYPKQCKVSSNKDNSIFLEPENDELDFQNARIWFDDNRLISKIEIRDNTDALYEVVFNTILINQNLKDSVFKIEPEGDIKVIDLR